MVSESETGRASGERDRQSGRGGERERACVSEEQGEIVLFFPFGSDMTKNPRGNPRSHFAGMATGGEAMLDPGWFGVVLGGSWFEGDAKIGGVRGLLHIPMEI